MTGTVQTPSASETTPSTPGLRLASVDIIRGAVMVLMAIDHVRVYAGVPAGGPSPGVFFTRWVTHFCAPAFLFLAGTSAFLYGRTREDLPRFLASRGLWLILLELTVLRLAWTFNGDVGSIMGGVIWVIGWCMVLMAGLAKLPLRVVGAVGLIIMAGHNLLDGHLQAIAPTLAQDLTGTLWRIVYVGFWAGPIQATEGGPGLIILYSIVPWIGVMAAGFAFGHLLTLEPARRDRLCLILGLGATALFLVLRGFDLYGDPRGWESMTQSGPRGPGMPAALAFLNTTKYPASLQFLLMTLGPTIALIPLLERARGAVSRWLTVFGRVPFFYYLLHIPLIHALAILVAFLRMGSVPAWLFANHPLGVGPAPDGYLWSLPLLYAVFVVTVWLLYFPCRWFMALKARRRDLPWLRYL